MVEKHYWFMIMFGFGCLIGLVTLVYVVRRAFRREAGEIGGWELGGAGTRIAAVTRTTLAEGLRAKVASGFALLILVSIPIFWLTADGDGTIKGQVQMFMSYALGFTGFLLALLTILFSCRSLSIEVASRQIYSIASKPIPRWQILAGKWFGVMCLNVFLLALACGATYVGTRAIVSRFKQDLAHELELRGGLTPAQAANAVAVLDSVKGIGKHGAESPIVYAMADALGQPQNQVVETLLRLSEPTRVNLRRFDELRRQVLVSRASVSPKPPDLTEMVDERYEALKEEDRLPDGMTTGEIRKQIKADLMGDYCTIPPGGFRQPWRLQGPVPEQGSDYIMSLRFKVHVGGQLPAVRLPNGLTLEDDKLLCMWIIGDPTTPDFYEVRELFPVRSYEEFEIPVSCVEEDGTVSVMFGNIDPRRVDAVFDLPSGLEVRYGVGSFESNIFQAFLAILIPLTCLASFGVCASTFLSFPVGTLIVMALWAITSSMGFLQEALAVTSEYAPPDYSEFLFVLRRWIVDAIGWALAIGDCNPVDQLREGRAIGWMTLWANFWKFTLLKGGAVMFVGVLVFRRRELASVIV